MKTNIDASGRITLPAKLRQRDHIEPGQEFVVERVGIGEYRLKRVEEVGSQGLVEWLLACPEKGWFLPVESEPTWAMARDEQLKRPFNEPEASAPGVNCEKS